MTHPDMTRRLFLGGAASAAAAAAGPFVWTRRAGAAGKIVVRTIGGSYEEAVVKTIFDPFTKATGIEMVKVPATLGKLLAMFESGNIELDLVDAGELGMISLSQKGALEKIGSIAGGNDDGDERQQVCSAHGQHSGGMRGLIIHGPGATARGVEGPGGNYEGRDEVPCDSAWSTTERSWSSEKGLASTKSTPRVWASSGPIRSP